MLRPDIALPTKACHNCRKRRWKCDRSLPACHKCMSSNSECLGYGRLFVWNQGVASRGKMMGKTYEEQHSKSRRGSTSATHASRPEISNPSCSIESEERPEDNTEVEEVPRREPEAAVHTALVDPIYQDLSPNSRYYLYHYVTQICMDLVIYDGGPGHNPFRDLVPATIASPALLHIILAGSAHHVFNILRDPITPSTYQPDKRPCLVQYYQSVSRFSGPMKTSYADALLAKQQALSLMAKSVTSLTPANADFILATILMFINYDLIESGRDQWRVHVEGARQIIERLDKPPYLQNPMSKLRLTVLSDFLVFFVIGATFTSSTARLLIPGSMDLGPILEYTETNNYLSMPGPLLRIMVESFKLEDTRERTEDEIAVHVQDQLGNLLKAALDFDPASWAYGFKPATPLEDLDHRMHIAAAHRAAVCIYLARALPYTNPLIDPDSGFALVSLVGLADEILQHVSFFKPGDTLYKSISWPLFLAGAECEGLTRRKWIMDKLDEFYNLLYWGYVHTAKKTLEVIWSCKDKHGATSGCWISDIAELGYEILIA
ncbi:acriflavine sensitivity control protein acr-2 [Paraphaeosphaeria minitans]|uniref:Acriflavine sensitivity control protein acr-2 n=1 Tax=Paraphaeosphaeria minitans TaxID=565426 RepID=A0A9P6GNW3_9PLEO|nr:acriflavine sensitivity control protein acr-2 [Paraphaeosphaeria minitans]